MAGKAGRAVTRGPKGIRPARPSPRVRQPRPRSRIGPTGGRDRTRRGRDRTRRGRSAGRVKASARRARASVRVTVRPTARRGSPRVMGTTARVVGSQVAAAARTARGLPPPPLLPPIHKASSSQGDGRPAKVPDRRGNTGFHMGDRAVELAHGEKAMLMLVDSHLVDEIPLDSAHMMSSRAVIVMIGDDEADDLLITAVEAEWRG